MLIYDAQKVTRIPLRKYLKVLLLYTKVSFTVGIPKERISWLAEVGPLVVLAR